MGRHRHGQQVTLPKLAAHRDQQVPLDLAFYSLGDDLELERPRDLDNALGQRPALLGDGDAVHEGLVHLQHVDRQLPQVAEGGVPGAEVVDGQLHADGLQLDQVGYHPLVPPQQDALGQLEHERPGLETGRVEGPAHAVDETGCAELPGRHVHAHVQTARDPAVIRRQGLAWVAAQIPAPPRGVGGRPGQDPGAERHDLAGFFGQGDELAGQHHPPLRMRPPDQCLEPGQLAGGEGDDRLVGERERVAGHRFLQRGLQLPPPDQPGAQHRLVPAPLPLARRLGGVQGQVGVPEQFVGVGTVLGRGDPDGDRGEHRPGGEHERLGERRDHPVGGRLDRLDRRGLRGVGDEQRELVPAQPRRGVALADQAEQPHRRGHQQLVADTVAHRVVHDLEIVQVHEQHADGRAGPAGPRRPAARSGPGTAAGWAARSARRGRPGISAAPRAGAARSRRAWSAPGRPRSGRRADRWP